ncbi:MAG: cupin domain-containing protein [Bacteroidota bacterium]|nr:cupin domain-containing protein [Bacteroidota bacterium]
MSLKQELITKFELLPHPEGGYYKETYRSVEVIENTSKEFPHQRSYSTAIYFLIEQNNFSALHRIKSDELWHFYEGDALEVIEIDLEGNLTFTQVGREITKGQHFQYMVKAGHWFGSRVLRGGNFSFVGCTVSPGFDFNDFEMAKQEELCKLFPQYQKIIKELTRD